MSDLIVRNIKKTFTLSRKQMRIERTKDKRKIAVDGLSFEVKRGEIYGLLGPNGAGKTTALRCISTLIRPDEGDITVDGKSVLKSSLDVRRRIAFLTSELKLDDHFTPGYLFRYFSKLHGVDEKTMTERKNFLFSRFGIDKFEGVKVADLSTGMKQKTSLALALVHDPDFIIFDEPTNGLDILTARTVIDYLNEMRARGKAIVLSTHILDVVEKLCDRVGIIIDGSLKLSGSLSEVRNQHPDNTLESVFFNLMQATVGEENV